MQEKITTVSKTANKISLLYACLDDNNLPVRKRDKKVVKIDNEIWVQEKNARVKLEPDEIIGYLNKNGFNIKVNQRERKFPTINFN